MKSTYEIITDKNLIVETLSENISSKEYTKLKHAEFQDKKFNRNFNLITDLSNIDTSEEKIKELFIVFKENKGKFIRNKSAIVSSIKDKKILDAIIKTDKKIVKEVKTFTNLDDAKSWMS